MNPFAPLLSHPLIDALLDSHREKLGKDADGYRNHVFRVLNFYLALGPDTRTVEPCVAIAAAFHDLGIWTDGTFDYLAPSAALAARYIREAAPDAVDAALVRELIVQHHKLCPYRSEHAWMPTVERWRKADLIDVSMGVIPFGLPRKLIRSVQHALPNKGFHARLLALTAKEFVRRPWNPLPMMRL